jgi:hypothetical protein
MLRLTTAWHGCRYGFYKSASELDRLFDLLRKVLTWLTPLRTAEVVRPHTAVPAALARTSVEAAMRFAFVHASRLPESADAHIRTLGLFWLTEYGTALQSIWPMSRWKTMLRLAQWLHVQGHVTLTLSVLGCLEQMFDLRLALRISVAIKSPPSAPNPPPCARPSRRPSTHTGTHRRQGSSGLYTFAFACLPPL